MKHSPFPWTATENSWQYTTIYTANGTEICRLDLEDWGVTEENQEELEAEQEKVARLIAAAPDLLGALIEKMKNEKSRYDKTDKAQAFYRSNNAKALAAIAKATGEET